MRLRFLFIAWLGFALVALTPARALADGRADVAKIKAAADEAMDNLRYGDALEGYRKAWEATHDPRFLYNMGRALGALAQYPAAVEKLEQFAAVAPPELKARVPLDKLIADFKRYVSTIALRCNVSGARVLVRGKDVGRTPLADLRVDAGPATIEVDADGYQTMRKRVDLPGAGRVEVAIDLVKATATGILVVRSTPAATSVLIDGKGLGGTPLEAPLLPGSHALLLSRDGYRDLATHAIVERGVRRELDFSLEKTPSILSRWWFWTIVGVVVTGAIAGTVTGVVCTSTTACERPADPGTIPPNQVRGP
jgi:hypothetical protein